MNIKKSIIVGGGEIGKSLYNILSEHYDTTLIDIDIEKCIIPENNLDSIEHDIMHVCFPFSDKFEEQVCYWYVLVGYDTTPEEDLERLNYLRSRKQLAYVQRYCYKNSTIFYITLARWVNQRHMFCGMTWLT